MADDYIEALPTAEYLNSLANDRLEWKLALGELIDNALDANAKRVLISLDPPTAKRPAIVKVEDDGDGCANLVDMVCLGKHTHHKTTKLGRFGIGAKNAMLWIGHVDSTTAIVSTRGHVTRRLLCAWKAYAERWRISRDWLDEREADPGACGTSVEIRPCKRRFPEGRGLETLVDDLGYYYSWAIKRGVQIQIRIARKQAIVLQRWELPPLTDVVDTQIVVGHRGARVYVGIVKDGPNRRPGITYVHGFRVVLKHCALGCGGADYSGVCGFVELDGAWDLTKNKDDVSMHKEELGDAVYTALKELLAKAEFRSQALEFSLFDSQVQSALGALLGPSNGKAARSARDEHGSKKPTAKGGRHKRSSKEQNGSSFPRRTSPPRVVYRDLGDEDRLGENSENCIVLNTANPFVQRVRAARNVDAMVVAAAFILIEGVHSEAVTGQRKLRFEPTGEITRDVGRLLAHPVALDGVSIGDDATKRQPANTPRIQPSN